MDNQQQPQQSEDPNTIEQQCEQRPFSPWEQAFNRDLEKNDREFDY
ncbi:hypothetical protein NKY44_16910 [Sinorhizobium meliloti]